MKRFIIVLLVFFCGVLNAQTLQYFKNQVTCLADNIYYEARGEDIKGWKAVASVTMNRYRDKHYPSSVCGVVYQKRNNICQFSWVCNKPNMNHRNSKLYTEIYDVAIRSYIGYYKDNTDGALFYHTTALSKSKLGLNKQVVKTIQIGNHIFYK